MLKLMGKKIFTVFNYYALNFCLEAKVCAQSTDLLFSVSLSRKSGTIRLTDCLDMSIAVDWHIILQTKQRCGVDCAILLLKSQTNQYI